MTPTDSFEQRLEAGLRALGDEAEIPRLDPSDLGRRPVGPAGRHLGRLLVAAALIVGIGIAGFLLATRSPDQEVNAAGETALPTPAVVEEPLRLLLDGGPTDLILRSALDSSDLGTPATTYSYTAFGDPEAVAPAGDAPRLMIFGVEGFLRPPLDGTPIDLGARQGVVESDGTVGFEVDDAVIRVRGSDLSVALADLAAALDIDTDGRPIPWSEPPDGLELIGSLTSGVFDELSISAPLDGRIAQYQGDGGRWLSVSTQDAFANALETIGWTSADAESTELGGRAVVLTSDGDVRSANWIEGGSLVRVMSHKLSVDELAQSVAAVVAVDDWPEPPPAVAVDPATGPPGDTSELAGAPRVVATELPDGFEVILAGDHVDFGEPWFSARGYVWAPEGTEIPGPDDRIVIFTSGGITPPFPGEHVDIAGAAGVIIDKVASNSPSDLFLVHLDMSATLQGQNVTVDELIAAATVWVESGEREPPADLISDLVLVDQASGGGWQTVGGPSGVSGTANGSTVVYQDAGRSDRLLQVTSAPAEEAGGINYTRWTFPNLSESVDVAGIDGVLFEPAAGFIGLRFASGDRIIDLRAENLDLREVMAAAESLRAATDDEWNIGLP